MGYIERAMFAATLGQESQLYSPCNDNNYTSKMTSYQSRPVARLGIEGGQDIFQAGPDMFVTLTKRCSKMF